MIHTNELMYMSLCYTPWADNLAFGTQAKCKTLYMCLTQWGGVTDRPCAPSTDFHLSLKAHRDFPCGVAFWHRVGWVSEYYLEMLSQLKCFYTQPLYCVDPKGKQYVCLKEYWTWLMSMPSIALDTIETTSGVSTAWWEGPPRGVRQLRQARPHACATLKFS